MYLRLMAVVLVCAGFALQACSTDTGMRPRGGFVAAPPAGTTAASGDKARSAGDLDLKSFDGDGDNTVTRNELDEGLKRNFGRQDINANGVLEPSEARSFNERLSDQPTISPVIDWNADGKIVMAEFSTQWRTMFEKADIDRNGVIDPKELAGRVREYKPRKLREPTFSGKDGRPPGNFR